LGLEFDTNRVICGEFASVHLTSAMRYSSTSRFLSSQLTSNLTLGLAISWYISLSTSALSPSSCLAIQSNPSSDVSQIPPRLACLSRFCERNSYRSCTGRVQHPSLPLNNLRTSPIPSHPKHSPLTRPLISFRSASEQSTPRQTAYQSTISPVSVPPDLIRRIWYGSWRRGLRGL
jgi:hypothetical protein